ncbi:hypothetical protein RUM43_008769 [Polyplax serrata]|uniref:BTB domain-containing protein n=1 Tax=Polyplax serrata TaxID=468196 RepID=A0AAN8P9S4_POLSC
METNQQFSLRWNNYVQHITCAFDNLRSDEDLVDVTLSCEGRKILAHKMLLSACSTYFKNVFKENPCKHPVIIFRNVKFEDLVAIVDFMYHGEVNVEQEQLSSFLTTAEMLAVQGLTDGTGPAKENFKEENRRKQFSLLESSLLGSVHEPVTNNRQNHQQKPQSRSNISHSSTPGLLPGFFNQPQSNRPSTPTLNNKKRKFSPVKVVNSITNKESGDSEIKQTNKKKLIREEMESMEVPVVPKVEVNDFDDNDSSYSEQESATMDISQHTEKNQEKDNVEIFSTNSRDSPYPATKQEGVPASEIDKGISPVPEQAMLKPGPSGNVDTLQASLRKHFEKEWMPRGEVRRLLGSDKNALPYPHLNFDV